MSEPASRSGWVYVIAPVTKWPCKIGVSQDVRKRLRALQAFHWEELRLFHCRLHSRVYNAEAFLHSQFKDRRLKGEWFDITTREAIEAFDRIPVVRESDYKNLIIRSPFVPL